MKDGSVPAVVGCIVVIDEEFRHPRLAAIHDALDPDRRDLDAYVGMAAELGARRVIDMGCGTGTLALMLADRGCDVVAVDPAVASLAIARGKPGGQRVRWVEGDATSLPVTDRDLATITGNAAQSIADPMQWTATLTGIRAALQPGGHVVFETRDPAARGWERWTKEATYRTTEIPDEGTVTSWVELSAIDWPLVSFRWTWIFDDDGATLTPDSTLRFRERDEVEADLTRPGTRWSMSATLPTVPDWSSCSSPAAPRSSSTSHSRLYRTGSRYGPGSVERHMPSRRGRLTGRPVPA